MNASKPPRLLWNLGDDVPYVGQAIDTVADCDAHETLGRVVEKLIAPRPAVPGSLDDLATSENDHWPCRVGYPCLLVASGVRLKTGIQHPIPEDSAAQPSPLFTCFGARPEDSDNGIARTRHGFTSG